MAVQHEMLVRAEAVGGAADEKRPPLPPTPSPRTRVMISPRVNLAEIMGRRREVERLVMDDDVDDNSGIFSEGSLLFDTGELEIDSESEEEDLSGLQLVESSSLWTLLAKARNPKMRTRERGYSARSGGR